MLFGVEISFWMLRQYFTLDPFFTELYSLEWFATVDFYEKFFSNDVKYGDRGN